MKERLLLEHIDYEQGTIELEGRTYSFFDTSFPTIDLADPYRLTEGKRKSYRGSGASFIHCEKLKTTLGCCLKKAACTRYIMAICFSTDASRWRRTEASQR